MLVFVCVCVWKFIYTHAFVIPLFFIPSCVFVISDLIYFQSKGFFYGEITVTKMYLFFVYLRMFLFSLSFDGQLFWGKKKSLVNSSFSPAPVKGDASRTCSNIFQTSTVGVKFTVKHDWKTWISSQEWFSEFFKC